MMNKILLLGIILLISNKIIGQTEYYVDFSGAYSFIPRTEKNGNTLSMNHFGLFTTTISTESFDVNPGFNIGLGFTRQLTHKFLFNSGIGFSFFQYNKKLSVDFIENIVTFESNQYYAQPGLPVAYFYGFRYINPVYNVAGAIEKPNNVKTKILYLVIPVKIQYSFLPDKFNIGMGVTNYFIAYSSQISQVKSFTQFNDKSNSGLNNYQLNGNISFEYRISKALWIQTSYDHGFSRIYDKSEQSDYPSQSIGDTKYRTVELGVKFDL